MTPSDSSEIFAIPENWPKCPQCEKQNLLVGGHLALCVECSFLGSIREVSPTTVLQLSRAKLANNPAAERAVLSFLYPLNAKAIKLEDVDEWTRQVYEKGTHVAQRLIHYPFLAQAAQELQKHGKLDPVAILNEHVETSDHLVLPIGTVFKLKSARELCTRQSVVSFIYESNPLMEFTLEPDRQKQRGILVIETHIYNAPSHVQAWEFDRHPTPSNFRLVAPDITNQLRRNSVVWQPLDWSVIHFEAPNIQPLWLGVVENPGLNATYSVSENLEGLPIVEASFRIPGNPQARKIETFDFKTAEAGIRKLRELWRQACSLQVDFSEEMEFCRTTHPALIMYQIRKNPTIWGH